MQIDKAVKLLTYSSEQNTMLITGDDKDALKLGIEALEAYAQARRSGLPLRCELLPSETKD